MTTRQFYIHTDLVELAKRSLEAQGYKIVGTEVEIKDIKINGKIIRVDLLVEKDGKTIPIECGHMQGGLERVRKLKKKFGAFKQIKYSSFNKMYDLAHPDYIERRTRRIINVGLSPTMYEDLMREVENDGTTVSEFCREAISREMRDRGLRRKIREALGWRSEITLGDVIMDELARGKNET